jgi:hypothetical protein
MPGRGQPRRGHTENAGLGQAQAPPLEQIALGTGAVHGAQQCEKLGVRTEQHVLAVVDDDLIRFDSTGSAAQRLRGFEHRDRAPCLGKRYRRRKACVAPTDDRDSLRH